LFYLFVNLSTKCNYSKSICSLAESFVTWLFRSFNLWTSSASSVILQSLKKKKIVSSVCKYAEPLSQFFIPSLQLDNIWLQFLLSDRPSRRLRIDQTLSVPLFVPHKLLHVCLTWELQTQHRCLDWSMTAQLFLKHVRQNMKTKGVIKSHTQYYAPDMKHLYLLQNHLLNNSPMHNISMHQSFSLRHNIKYCIHAYQMFPQLKKSAYLILPAKTKNSQKPKILPF